METIKMQIRRNKAEAIDFIARIMFGKPCPADLKISVLDKKTGIKEDVIIRFNGKKMEYLKIKGKDEREYPERYWGDRKDFVKFMNREVCKGF